MNPSQFRTPSNLKRTETSHSHRRSPQRVVQQIKKPLPTRFLSEKGNINGLFRTAYSNKSGAEWLLREDDPHAQPPEATSGFIAGRRGVGCVQKREIERRESVLSWWRPESADESPAATTRKPDAV